MRVLCAIATTLTDATTNAPDLLARWSPAMETQVLVAQGDGERVGKIFTDGVDKWWHIRTPKKANTDEAFFHDYELTFDLAKHVDGIGSTGWDWKNKRSRWFGFDFDSITGHAVGVGVTDDDLQKVRNAAASLPYVETRRSTSGHGLHLYVYTDENGLPCANHTEHAAIARCVLQQMSNDCGFDFAQQVDVCGGNMWLWHRKHTPENRGLEIVTEQRTPYTLADLPINWRHHVDVVTRKRNRVRVEGVENVDEFDRFTAAYVPQRLDETHKRIITELGKTGFSSCWIADHNLVQTHTVALKKVHENFNLAGIFKTASEATDKYTPNCFAFPGPNGTFKVYRFNAANECATWRHDDGKTWCEYNTPATLDTAARAFGGVERVSGGYAFESYENARNALQVLQVVVDDVPQWASRQTELVPTTRGLVCKVDRAGESAHPFGWSVARGQRFAKLLEHQTDQAKTNDIRDDLLRYVKKVGADDPGCFYAAANGETWDYVSPTAARQVLAAHAVERGEIDHILGQTILNRWRRVCVPFAPEFPGSRQWNKGAPSYRVEPATTRTAKHPHFDLVLKHCGQSLDADVAALEWARDAGITTGADYLRAYVASCIRYPFDPLPYLFLYGGEESGKSSYWQAIDVIIEGVTRCENALVSGDKFNGNLESTIVAVIEEVDAKGRGVLAKLKDYVTSPVIPIRRMRQGTYDAPNTTHWVHTAQHLDYCPIFDGDTRITAFYVDTIPRENQITDLKEKLAHEASAFLRTLLDMELPARVSRLRLPVVETAEKRAAQEANRDSLGAFVAGLQSSAVAIPFADFYAAFIDSLDAYERVEWSRQKVARRLPPKIKRFTKNKISYVRGVAI